MWPLVLAATAGLSGSALFAYSSGVFMEETTAAFGWSRAQFSGAFMLQMCLGIFILPAVGRLTDRYGPRRIVLWGALPFAASISLLGLATGSILQWWLLCGLIAIGQGTIAQTVWVTAVIGRFNASRGLAMAVTLSGLSLGSLVWPPLAAYFVQTLGWRAAYPALAVTWLVIVLPLVAAFFFGASHKAENPKLKNPGVSYLAQLKTPTFIGLMIAGGFFASAYYGLTIHIVPMLKSNGLSLGLAASIAGLAGLFAIIGRLLAGYLLDRFPTRPIGVAAFLLPIGASLLLLSMDGSTVLAVCSVALLGLAAGAEMDIITFIAARHFGREVFASVYSVFVAVIAICASSGPMLAGALFDARGSYDFFLMAVIGLVAVGAAVIAIIPIASSADADQDLTNLE